MSLCLESRPGKGARGLPQQKNITPMAISSTPTNYNQVNDNNNIKLDPKERLTQYNEDPPKCHNHQFRLIFCFVLLLMLLTRSTHQFRI